MKYLKIIILFGSICLLASCSKSPSHQAKSHETLAASTSNSVSTPSSSTHPNYSSNSELDSSASSTDSDSVGETAFIFPERMQGTWYANLNGKLAKILIKGSQYGETPGQTYQAFDANKVDQETRDFHHGRNHTIDQNRNNSWVSVGYMTGINNIFSSNENPSQVVSLRGWYQNAGPSTLLFVTTEHVDQNTVDVLTTASSTLLQNGEHYYKSPDLAFKYQQNSYECDQNTNN